MARPLQTVNASRFIQVLEAWRIAAGMTQRDLAKLILYHESRLTQLRRQPGAMPTPDFMRACIGRAPAPWKSRLRLAATADLLVPEKVA